MSTTAWVAIARLLMICVFAQSIFAGVFLSGETWGRDAHRLMAYSLVGVTVVLGIAAAGTLREVPGGPRITGALVGLAVALAIQTALGLLSAEGQRLQWLHVPFGVALVGFAASLEPAARQLGQAHAAPAEEYAGEYRA